MDRRFAHVSLDQSTRDLVSEQCLYPPSILGSRKKEEEEEDEEELHNDRQVWFIVWMNTRRIIPMRINIL